jgi:NitT/TauT family transport system permease protein
MMNDDGGIDQRSRMRGGKWFAIIAPIAVFGLVACAWHISVIAFRIPPVILPKPNDVLVAMWNQKTELLRASWVTLQASLLGLMASVIVGSLVAILFSQSRWVRTAFYPYVIFLQTVPIVAIAPLLIIWSGTGLRTVVLVSCIISIFPIISNVTSGLLSVDQNHLDLFRMQDASRWQTLTKLRVPSAIPNLVLGLRVSCGLAVIGAIVGELFVASSGAYEGLGMVMNAKQANYKTAELMGTILACTSLGILLFVSIQFIGNVVLRRWTKDAGFEST